VSENPFSIGQKVICINTTIRTDALPFVPLRPKLGEIYTVSSLHIEPHIDEYGIRLAELPNPPIIWSDGDEVEWSFDTRKFRPLVSDFSSLPSNQRTRLP
jgi:hypothetical protein